MVSETDTTGVGLAAMRRGAETGASNTDAAVGNRSDVVAVGTETRMPLVGETVFCGAVGCVSGVAVLGAGGDGRLRIDGSAASGNTRERLPVALPSCRVRLGGSG